MGNIIFSAYSAEILQRGIEGGWDCIMKIIDPLDNHS